MSSVATLRSVLVSSSLVCRIPQAVIITSTRGITSKEWREKHNRFRDRLSDMPDWSYTDGRGYGPPSIGQKERYIAHQELGKTVVRRMQELVEAKKIK